MFEKICKFLFMSMLPRSYYPSKKWAKILTNSYLRSMRSGHTSRYTFSVIFLCVKSWDSFSPISSRWTIAEITNTDANTQRKMKKSHLFQWWESISSRSSLTISNWLTSSSLSSTNFCCTKEKARTCHVRKSEKVFIAWKAATSIWMLSPSSKTKSQE